MATFYHGTSEENWAKIQAEGVLWGVGSCWAPGDTGYRYTYLTPHIEVAQAINPEVMLEVEYEPRGVGVRTPDGKAIDNFGFNPPPGETCWQFSVFVPIPLAACRRIDP